MYMYVYSTHTQWYKNLYNYVCGTNLNFDGIRLGFISLFDTRAYFDYFGLDIFYKLKRLCI